MSAVFSITAKGPGQHFITDILLFNLFHTEAITMKTFNMLFFFLNGIDFTSKKTPKVYIFFLFLCIYYSIDSEGRIKSPNLYTIHRKQGLDTGTGLPW